MAKKKTEPSKSKKQSKPAQPAGSSPLIDTAQAAASVARILATRAKLEGPEAGESPDRESGEFRKLKEGLTKHPSLSAANSLNAALGVSKNALPIPGRRDSVHSQTQGNVARVNVPRRTAG